MCRANPALMFGITGRYVHSPEHRTTKVNVKKALSTRNHGCGQDMLVNSKPLLVDPEGKHFQGTSQFRGHCISEMHIAPTSLAPEDAERFEQLRNRAMTN